MKRDDGGKNDVMPIKEIDLTLAQHPFGNTDYISEQMHRAYLRRLNSLAQHLPVAGTLAEKIATLGSDQRLQTLGDTVLRCAIQHAQVQIETGGPYGLPLDECEQVLAATVEAIDNRRHAPLGSALHDTIIADAPGHGWIWNEECPDSVFKRAFRHILAIDYGADTPCTPDADEMAMFRRAAALLDRLMPASSASVLNHTHLAVVFPSTGVWSRRMSSSEYRISGSIFLNRQLLTNPWLLAEHLYHESLHQQFYDLRAGHQVLAPGFTRAGAPLIHSPWNRPDASRNSYWDVHRALAAFHVYVHLGLLAKAAEQDEDLQDEYGPIAMMGSRTALVRAHYLNQQLRTITWDELGPAGQRLLDWFAHTLDAIDPSPPAAGADAHLLLDRYWREAHSISALQPDSSTSGTLLTTLAAAEARTGQQVFAAMGCDEDAFRQSLNALPAADPVTHFAATREFIATTILEHAPADFRLSASGDTDLLVRHMVESSSQALMPVLERPRAQGMPS